MRSTCAGRLADREQRAAAPRPPSGPASSSSATTSAASARSAASSGVGRAGPCRRWYAATARLPHQHPGAAQRPVERVDQVGHPAHVRPGAGPGTARTPPPPAPRRRRPAARGSGGRWTGRRPAAPAPGRPRRRPSPRRPPAAGRATLRTTIAACSRGRRSGAAGTTVAATSATAPPISASVHRVSAAPGSGSRVLTTIDCTAAWVTNSWPPSSRIAAVIASADDQRELPPARADQPAPAGRRPKTPTATPTVTSATRRSRWPYDVPRRHHGRDRREERGLVAQQVGGEPPGDAGRDRALGDLPALRRATASSRALDSDVRPRLQGARRTGAPPCGRSCPSRIRRRSRRAHPVGPDGKDRPAWCTPSTRPPRAS